MSPLEALVKEFLAQKSIAVVGVSDRRDTGCNANYRKLKAAGYAVSAVNPRLSTFEGDACYPDLRSIPQKPEAVFVLANRRVTEQVVRECVDLGIGWVWMHHLMGTKPGLAPGMSSVSAEAVRLCRENGIKVIPGACPLQFLNADPGHALMRTVFRAIGFHRVA